jgi:hypothetical protein
MQHVMAVQTTIVATIVILVIVIQLVNTEIPQMFMEAMPELVLIGHLHQQPMEIILIPMVIQMAGHGIKQTHLMVLMGLILMVNILITVDKSFLL